jgi:hypothetical protein
VLYLLSDCFATGPGVDISALGLLAENDDAGSGLVCSTIDYMLPPLTAQTTFYIMVEGFGYNEGVFQLCVGLQWLCRVCLRSSWRLLASRGFHVRLRCFLRPLPLTAAAVARCSGYTFYFSGVASSVLQAADDGNNVTASGTMEVSLTHTAAAAVATGGLMMLGAATGGCGVAF